MDTEETRQPPIEAAGQSPAERSIPEVHLEQVDRSDNPVNEVTAGREGVLQTVEQWGEYSLVTVEGLKALRVFDEHGNSVDDFTPISGTEQFIDLPSYILARGKTYLGENPDSSTFGIDGLPSCIRPRVQKLLKEKRSASIYYSHLGRELITPDTSHIQIVEGGKYILVGSELGYVAYQTHDAHGRPQHPRKWTRFDSVTEEGHPLPLDLKPYIEAKDKKDAERVFEDINAEYCTGMKKDEVSIYKKGHPDTPVFTDPIVGAQRNFCVDPSNSNIVYYCRAESPKELSRLDLSGDPSSWQVEGATFPAEHSVIQNLHMDPSGEFFVFSCEAGVVVMSKDGLQERHTLPEHSNPTFDPKGQLRTVDKEGYLTISRTNLAEVSHGLRQKRAKEALAGLNVQDLFATVGSSGKAKPEERHDLEYLRTKREEYESTVRGQAQALRSVEDAQTLLLTISNHKLELARRKLKPDEIHFMTESAVALVGERQEAMVADQAAETLARVDIQLTGSLSLAVVAEIREELARLEPLRPLLRDEALRKTIDKTKERLAQAGGELFRREGEVVIREVRGLVDGVRARLEAIERKSDFDEWMEFDYPSLKSRLGALTRDCPLEAADAFQAIQSARASLDQLAHDFEQKFRQQYARVREQAAKRTDTLIATVRQDVDSFLDRVREKGFRTRSEAEVYVEKSPACETIRQDIDGCRSHDAQAAKELDRSFRSRLAVLYDEIDRGASVKVAETGQQMIAFGKTLFPKWEHRVAEKEQKAPEVDLVFVSDKTTRASAGKADEVYGDMSLRIASHGRSRTVPLYADAANSDQWGEGVMSWKGNEVQGSYVQKKDFTRIKADLRDWRKGGRSALRQEFEERRNALREWYGEREKKWERESAGTPAKKRERDPERDAAWQTEYRTRLEALSDFAAEHHIPLLRSIERLENQEDVEYANGKGTIPEWRSHWVVDAQTEEHLEQMAQAFEMQGDLQEGLLNLKGHAGTGKDVLIRMFCAKTNRPYFAVDCSKWTTEFELSEDVTLRAENGVSYIEHVPSTVLDAISTPGAVLYFNEINAMPEQAQIFLHSLMDEKRSVTLKTESGRVVRADPSVLIASSMNPGYPGTYDPQFATRSRMVSMEIGYPPLHGKPREGDANPNPPFSSAEALRIARDVESLADLTFDPSLERNTFVQMWDRYVNGSDTGAPEPTAVQKFDMDVILALVQFGEKLREGFVATFEKTRRQKDLEVRQPLTGRELRRSAYTLGKMPAEDRVSADPDNTARELLRRFFLTNIDRRDERGKIETAMETWVSTKRLAA